MTASASANKMQTGSSLAVELPEDCTIRGVQLLALNLMQAIGSSPVVIEGRGVKSIDVTGLQVLLSAQRTARLSGGTLAILTGNAGALRLAADRAGLAVQFEKLFATPPA